MLSKIRVGLLGYGYWGPNYARALSEMSRVSVSFICDAQDEQLRRAASRYPQIPILSDVSDAMRRDDTDAVIISTPASTHYKLARLVLESGRHVIVEKPLALEIEHCQELGELADTKGLVLMVAHTFLYNSGIQKLREYVNSSSFGRVYYLHATRTNLGPIRHDVNAVWDLAPHDISIFNYLLDEQPQWASAIGSRALGNEREDVAFITLGYSNDVVGNIHVSWADPNKVREVVVVGSRQRLVFDDLNSLERVRVYEKGVSVGETHAGSFGEFKLLMRDGDIISPKIELNEPLKTQISDFVDSILENRRPISDALTGMHVVETLKAIDTSIRERGRAVEVAKCKVASQSN
ncbi:MAG: Gfo/Idh/MocA family oxidoreductase [Candidatus Acidiferrales bacterium]